jgi:catechol 2,3-dioxygenase-like lactoylglutathione lyase family enzyme
MIDHLGIGVIDLGRSKSFYEKALAPLGIGLMYEPPGGDAAGFGADGQPFFWIGAALEPGAPIHVAFMAESRGLVDAFYAAAIVAGGRDNGPPGIREHYHPNYYGAFVLDPDGHNIEAVCHLAE